MPSTSWYQRLIPMFSPLVGQKILKADGSLLKKWQDALPTFEYSNELHVYRHTSNYSLAWTVKTCEFMPPGSCMYHETTVYIGELKGQTLEKLSRPFEARDDYTVEEIENKRAEFEAAKKAMEAARSKLYPFGENDY